MEFNNRFWARLCNEIPRMLGRPRICRDCWSLLCSSLAVEAEYYSAKEAHSLPLRKKGPLSLSPGRPLRLPLKQRERDRDCYSRKNGQPVAETLLLPPLRIPICSILTFTTYFFMSGIFLLAVSKQVWAKLQNIVSYNFGSPPT